VLFAEVARTVVLILLGAAIVTHRLLLAEVYAAAFLVTAFETLFDSATMAVIPQMVGDGDLMRANSRLQVAKLSGEQFLGPALGGVLFAIAASVPVLFDGLTYAASAAFLALALRPARRLGRHGQARRDDGFALAEPVRSTDRPSLFREMREGLAWLAHEQRLRLVTGLIASFAFCQGLGLGILVVYCTKVLHLSGASFGLFIAATESGNTIGALAAPRVGRWLGPGRALLYAGLTGGAAFMMVGTTSSVPVALVALWVEAVAVGVGNVTMVALRQGLIPLDLAGRVSSAMRSSFLGAASLATLAGGALVLLLGIHAPFAIGGLAQLLAALLIGGALARRLAADERDVLDLTETVDVRETPVDA
jgi:hypothetical protein